MTTRRAFLTGLLAAPLVVRTPGLLMPVRPVVWTPRCWNLSYIIGPGQMMVHTHVSESEPKTIPAEAPAGTRWRLIEPKGA